MRGREEERGEAYIEGKEEVEGKKAKGEGRERTVRKDIGEEGKGRGKGGRGRKGRGKGGRGRKGRKRKKVEEKREEERNKQRGIGRRRKRNGET